MLYYYLGTRSATSTKRRLTGATRPEDSPPSLSPSAFVRTCVPLLNTYYIPYLRLRRFLYTRRSSLVRIPDPITDHISPLGEMRGRCRLWFLV
ncbi:hypothetical protein CBS63078_8250 [Aspergillus niger]|nr:hypothetical protein CBS63078_8250 [Aspergillus niger]KAI2936971.1 hypothetical protein CBS147322_11012 [Aspergillus niger]KAI3038659.1 hypothetical protein CBS76997_8391 [Aspergillus niger]